jgi:DNA invertase Pin-like site-specific DNA recombinase
MSTNTTNRRRKDAPAEPDGPRRVYGYVRVSTDKQAASPEAQREAIKRAAERNGLAGDIVWFQDAPVQNPDGSWNDAASGKVALAERAAGKEMCGRLRRGDVVIVAKMDRAFRRLADCVLMLDKWQRLGVSVVICDFPMLVDLDNPYQMAMAQQCAVWAELERKLISQRTKEALALRKRKGQRHNRFAGYGFTFEKRYDPEQRRQVKVRVRDDEERSIMGQILKWKMDGHGWDSITEHLRKQGVQTKHGTPWSRARVMRAFQAELRLQAQENRVGDK